MIRSFSAASCSKRPKLGLFLGRERQCGCICTDAIQFTLWFAPSTCIAARDQTGTGLYWQNCSYQAKGRDSSSNPPSIPQIMSAALALPLGSPEQFHLMDKKRPRQPRWFSLKRRKQIAKILLETSSSYLQHAEEAELGSPQRPGTNAAAWKILLMLLRSFHLVWWEWMKSLNIWRVLDFT